MSEFTQNITSPFPNQNILFNSASGITGQQIQSNQLANQGRQLDLSNANMAQVQQAAAGLLSAYPDEASRAAAYPRVVSFLQSQGFAMNASKEYPGEGVLRSLVNQGIPGKDLYSSGALLTPAQQALLSRTPGTSGQPPPGTTAPTGTPGAAPAGGGGTGPAPFVGANLPSGVTPDEDQLVRTVYGEARGEPVAGQQAVASVIKTRMGLGKQGVQDVVFAPNQFEAWSDPKNRPGMEALDPNSPQYQAILNNVVRPVMSGQARDPTGGATNFYNPALQAQLGRSTPGFAQGNRTTIGNHEFYYGGYAPRGTATAAATPAAAPAGAGGTTAPYQTASNAPVPPPGSTAAPGGPAAAAPQFTYPNGKTGGAPDAQGGVSYTDGSYGTPPAGRPTPVAAASPPASTAAPAQPGQPPGSTAPPAGQQSPAAAPLAPTAGSPGAPPAAGLKYNINSQGAPAGTILGYLPNGTAVLAGPVETHVGITGWNADGTPIRGGAPGASATPPAAAAAPAQPGQPPAAAPGQPPPAASPSRLPDASTIPTGQNSVPYKQAMQLQQEAMQYDAVAGTNPAFAKRAADLRLQAQQIIQAGATVSAQQNGREGTLEVVTGKFTPYTPLPSPRGMQGTAAAWDGTKWVPVTPDNQANAVQGTWAVTGSGAQFYPNSPGAIQRQEEAKTSGAATGTQTAQTLPALIAQARAAAKNEGDIDYASNQIAQAAKGGIPTGYFSGALGVAAAVAKSLGIDTTSLGVNPQAVGDIQSAQKTLAVLGGAILQQAIGKGNPITDAKIEAFEHTQPGIETDPQALQRIMAWARSQYTYERELGVAAVQEAAKPENNGILPPSFIPRYYATKGFAPVYEPNLGEMQQPDGRQPARETPPPVTSMAPMKVNDAADYARVPSGKQYTDPDGHTRIKP